MKAKIAVVYTYEHLPYDPKRTLVDMGGGVVNTMTYYGGGGSMGDVYSDAQHLADWQQLMVLIRFYSANGKEYARSSSTPHPIDEGWEDDSGEYHERIVPFAYPLTDEQLLALVPKNTPYPSVTIRTYLNGLIPFAKVMILIFVVLVLFVLILSARF